MLGPAKAVKLKGPPVFGFVRSLSFANELLSRASLLKLRLFPAALPRDLFIKEEGGCLRVAPARSPGGSLFGAPMSIVFDL